MPGIRVQNGKDVFTSALDRLIELYEKREDEIVVSFSAGKDSMVVLEMAITGVSRFYGFLIHYLTSRNGCESRPRLLTRSPKRISTR